MASVVALLVTPVKSLRIHLTDAVRVARSATASSTSPSRTAGS